MAEFEGQVKAFVVDADEVVARIVEQVRPTARAYRAAQRKSLWLGVLIGVFVADPIIKGLRHTTKKLNEQNLKNDGFTTN